METLLGINAADYINVKGKASVAAAKGNIPATADNDTITTAQSNFKTFVKTNAKYTLMLATQHLIHGRTRTHKRYCACRPKSLLTTEHLPTCTYAE